MVDMKLSCDGGYVYYGAYVYMIRNMEEEIVCDRW